MKEVREAALEVYEGQFFLVEGMARTNTLRQMQVGRTPGPVGLGGLNDGRQGHGGAGELPPV